MADCEVGVPDKDMSGDNLYGPFWIAQPNAQELVVSVEPSPAFLCALEQFEDHCERGPVGQAALRSDRAVAHGGEGAFNGVGGPQVFPVLGREVVERQ